MADLFTPRFKSRVNELFTALKQPVQGMDEKATGEKQQTELQAELSKNFQLFEASVGKPEKEVAESIQKLFKSMADVIHRQPDRDNLEKALRLLRIVAEVDESLEKEIEEVQVGLNQKTQDQKQLEEVRDRLLRLLTNTEIAKLCASLLCQPEKLSKEKQKKVMERLNKEFASISEARVGQASYSEWGQFGVQFVALLFATIKMLAIKAGYDVPTVSEEEHHHTKQIRMPNGKYQSVLTD